MILLDTQVVVWLADETELLSRAALQAIVQARAADGLAISDKTLWEIAMLYARKRLRLEGSLLSFLDEIERMFLILPVTGAIAERSVRFGKAFPSDPADQLIAATAIVHKLDLVTADALIRKSGEVSCIW